MVVSTDLINQINSLSDKYVFWTEEDTKLTKPSVKECMTCNACNSCGSGDIGIKRCTSCNHSGCNGCQLL